ncbi:MAG: glutamate--tRNA ligase [Bacteroidales bacterium]|jgi:glutamyl-tRNA synthetase|nr:glutamate--tRNA ligase [Bacteroidales bacterium]
MTKDIRVRFAPSPTGPLHIGGVRTALYNYLFARHNKGKMILRIEDTDQARFVPGAEEYIVEAFKWCGIEFDEGIENGGPFGPYRQSERKGIYLDYAAELVRKGHAYYAFDTPEALEKMRKELEEEGARYTSYNAHSRMRMKNSLSMPNDEVKRRLSAGEPYVIRIRIPEGEPIRFHDMIRKDVEVDPATLDDKVLYKSDGMPTYHLANVVDDHLMKITHVIRGEEWLPSLPLHVLLYRYLGWEDSMPEFAHLPLLLKPDGKGKLSKRDGDRLGFPVFPLQWTDPKSGEVSKGYREDGYFPDAFVNMLALLGWNPGTEQEIFSIEELISQFSIERVNRSGARFDPEKTKWFNHQYLVNKSDAEIANEFASIVASKGYQVPGTGFLEKVVNLVKERVNFVHEIWDQASFFFVAPETYDEKTVKKRWKENTGQLLKEVLEVITASDPFERDPIHDKVAAYLEEKEIGMGQVMIGMRICLVGSGTGPDLFTIMEMIGKEETVERMEKGIQKIG